MSAFLCLKTLRDSGIIYIAKCKKCLTTLLFWYANLYTPHLIYVCTNLYIQYKVYKFVQPYSQERGVQISIANHVRFQSDKPFKNGLFH